MGGIGSGRWRCHQKNVAVEDCLALDIADLARQNLLAHDRYSTGTIRWDRGSVSCVEVQGNSVSRESAWAVLHVGR
jgi:hypothetical protein